MEPRFILDTTYTEADLLAANKTVQKLPFRLFQGLIFLLCALILIPCVQLSLVAPHMEQQALLTQYLPVMVFAILVVTAALVFAFNLSRLAVKLAVRRSGPLLFGQKRLEFYNEGMACLGERQSTESYYAELVRAIETETHFYLVFGGLFAIVPKDAFLYGNAEEFRTFIRSVLPPRAKRNF